MNPRTFFKLNSAFNWQFTDLQIGLICFSKFSLLSKVIPKSSTESFGMMPTSLILMVKSSGMVLFLFDTNIAWNFLGFTIIWFTLSQFMVACNSSTSISISKLRPDDYADKVLSSALLWSEVFVMKMFKSFRKIFKSKAPKTDPCGTPEISSQKVLYALLILRDCFLFLRYE